MPIDHTSLTVPASKLEGMVTFLTTSLAHLGFKEYMRPMPNIVGLGDVSPNFWLNTLSADEGDEKTLELVLKKTHIAFTATNIDQVKYFHAVALTTGATCNGPPGPRPHYHASYYSTFVRDPACGVNFEVVFHGYKGE